MTRKVGYGYISRGAVSSYDIRKGERELKRSHTAKLEKNQHKKQEKPKNIKIFGGVELNQDQYVSCKPAQVKGRKGYKVVFKNGMTVWFADQKKADGIQHLRLPGNQSFIDAAGSDITIHNIAIGEHLGTKGDENIILEACRNFDVDGGGGEDTITSKQVINYSDNSYKMKKGVFYEKKTYDDGFVRSYGVEYQREVGSDLELSITDNYEHKNRLIKIEKYNKEIQQIIKETQNNNSKKGVIIDDTKPFFSPDWNAIKKQIEKIRNQNLRKMDYDNLLKKVEDFQNNQIYQKMEDRTSRLEAINDLLSAKFKNNDITLN